MDQKQISPLPPERPDYLSEQIITYLGNKRSLLSFIGTAVEQVRADSGKEKLAIADLFSGSGIVARYFKRYAATLYVNDLEDYCQRINRCYLANQEDVDTLMLEHYFTFLKNKLDHEALHSGFIAELYSPADDGNIRPGERVFYTRRNAQYLDTARQLLEQIPEPYQTYLLAPLLCEASVHTNTSGVFKGFYKNSQTGIGQFGGDGRNALGRILGDIELKKPVFSRFSCDVHLYQEDANHLASHLPVTDLVYLDPPYNQHPYGSNYFMLNLINGYVRPQQISPVSGIPADWHKSAYNRKAEAGQSLAQLCASLKTNYLLISFNSDGFMSKDELVSLLSSLGEVTVLDKDYNTFRGCRNLGDRDIHVKEYLYLVKKYQTA